MSSPRILIHRLGSLGDTVLALPAFRLVRQAHPDAAITVLTNAPVSGKAAPLEAVLAGTGLADEVIPYPLGLRAPRQVAALVRRLRAGKFDLAVSLTAARGLVASGRDGLFFKASGIPHITGLPLHRRDLVCVRRGDGPLYEWEPERLLRRVKKFGTADPRDLRWFDLALNEGERTEAARLLESANVRPPFLAASLGTKTPLNDWGEANWTRLLGELSRAHPGLGLVLLGSADELARSEALRRAWDGLSSNLCGAAAPRVSAAILARAALFLGHDSGPLHLAGASGAPCVAVFSARCPPGQWFPPGEGHAILYPLPFHDPDRVTDPAWQRRALDSITVEQVLAEAHARLERNR